MGNVGPMWRSADFAAGDITERAGGNYISRNTTGVSKIYLPASKQSTKTCTF